MKKVVLVFMAIMASLMSFAQDEQTDLRLILKKQGQIYLAVLAQPLYNTGQLDTIINDTIWQKPSAKEKIIYHFKLVGEEPEIEKLLTALYRPNKVFSWADSTKQGERTYSGFLRIKERCPFSFKSEYYYYLKEANTLKIERRVDTLSSESTHYIFLLAYLLAFLLGLFILGTFTAGSLFSILAWLVALACVAGMPVATIIVWVPCFTIGLVVSFFYKTAS